VYLRTHPCSSFHAETNATQCVQLQLHDVLRVFGVREAFVFIRYLYDRDPIVQASCHSLTHDIGREAYRLFIKGSSFALAPEVAYCSYGFYHGFAEELFRRGGNTKDAHAFCAYVDTQLSTYTKDASLQCYHGIGHGLVNSHDPALWGDDLRIAAQALHFCDEASPQEADRIRCATGVFNGIAFFYVEHQYGLSLRPSDPLWVCRQQESRYKDACYLSMNVALIELTMGDFVKAARFIEAIPEDSYAQHAMINLAGPIGTRNQDEADHTGDVTSCRMLQQRLRLACIQGYAFGFMEQGKPGEEYVKPLAFCDTAQLSTEEKQACFSYIFHYLRTWYSTAKVQAICQQVRAPYRLLCLSGAISQ
jgi:hypothetical protein